MALNHCRRPVDEALAKAVPEIDLILGGHDHHQMCFEMNKIPILKSGSDFENLSIIHLNRSEHFKKPLLKSATVIAGRRWTSELNTLKVPKAEQFYPEIDEYIKGLFQKKAELDQQKSIENNKPKKDKVELPQSDWFVEYSYLNNRPTVSLRAGLSA